MSSLRRASSISAEPTSIVFYAGSNKTHVISTANNNKQFAHVVEEAVEMDTNSIEFITVRIGHREKVKYLVFVTPAG